jgi:hypothetical protein
MEDVMRIAFLLFALALPFAPGPASATSCSDQLIHSVEQRLPPLGRDVNVRDLSCMGVTQVFFLLNDRRHKTPPELRQDILAVFRSQGLTR